MNDSIIAPVIVRTQPDTPGLTQNHSEAITTIRTQTGTPGLATNHSEALTRVG
ncbi:hypothetical protein [Planotetraspora sp. GP83]|uniref:hypothetical protein n=1 Tax=Planotetraspora sp. GP83 TaxID=3156264 RepID=UPI003515A360